MARRNWGSPPILGKADLPGEVGATITAEVTQRGIVNFEQSENDFRRFASAIHQVCV